MASEKKRLAKAFYASAQIEYNSKVVEAGDQERLFSIARLLVFLIFAMLVFLVINNYHIIYLFFMVFVAGTFFYLIKLQSDIKKRLELYKNIAEITNEETLALEGDSQHFDPGAEFLSPEHRFSYDLDMFGERSLFQLLNRCTSEGGRNMLAEWLSLPLLEKGPIIKRQRAARELAEKRNFYLHFRAHGKTAPFSMADQEALEEWLLSKENSLKGIPTFLYWLLPVLTGISLLIWLIGLSSYSLFILFAFSQLALVYSRARVIKKIYEQLDSKFKFIQSFKKQVILIEEEHFEAAELVTVQLDLVHENTGASSILRKLENIMARFDSRLNPVGSLLFNALFLYELQTLRLLENWKKTYGKNMSNWLRQLYKLEACHSLGTFTYNNPDYVFPEISDEKFTIEAKGLFHPLMHPEKAVANDFSMKETGKIILITGSNMSGKSTYLRSVGTAIVMSQSGAPVAAASMVLTPLNLYSSMRVSDSLQDDTSYFYSELKRLKQITEVAESGDPVFILLDEILRGTNSTDKHDGSKALLKKLADFGANGLLATHDLSLSVMEQEQPENFINMSFESEVAGNNLYFDYKIKAGVCKSLNAVFLMKKMGIMD